MTKLATKRGTKEQHTNNEKGLKNDSPKTKKEPTTDNANDEKRHQQTILEAKGGINNDEHQ